MRTPTYVFTFNRDDTEGANRLKAMRDVVKVINNQRKQKGQKLYVVRVMGRNENRKHDGRHYRQTIPLKYASRFDVYCYEKF